MHTPSKNGLKLKILEKYLPEVSENFDFGGDLYYGQDNFFGGIREFWLKNEVSEEYNNINN